MITSRRIKNYARLLLLLGASEQNGIGFANKNLYKGTAILDLLTPEFRNRIDKILEFNKLTKEMVVHITDKFLQDLSNQI